MTRVTSSLQTRPTSTSTTLLERVYIDTPTLEDWSFVYDDKGNLTKYIDGSGSDVNFVSTTPPNPTQMLDPFGNPSSITWDSAQHLPREVIDARGVVTKNEYDAHANLIKVIVDIGMPPI